jgi:plastocyanin
MSGASRSLLLLGVLCLVSCAAATIALAAPGRRSVHAVHTCRHIKHHHCRRHPTGKQLHRKHKQGTPKPLLPKNTGIATPLTGPPAPVIPGAGSAESGSSGTSPSGTGSTPPTAETPSVPTGPEHVQLTAEDTEAFRFILSRPSVHAGPVVIEFVNHGQDEHNLNSEEPGSGSEIDPLEGKTAPNAHPSLSLNLHHGSYTLFCSLPGHRAKGMEATLKVE